MRESTIQRKILRKLKERGVYAVKVMTANRNGVPDILACHRGWFYGIEVKAPGGKLSAVQEANLDWIVEAGGIALVARSWEQIAHYFD